MNDKLIINSILKIYFSIVGFFIFIALTLSVTFLLLNSGVNLKNIYIDSLRINKLYIKWDEKLNIYIQEINISKNKSSKDSDFDLIDVAKHINKVFFIFNITQTIVIEKISYGDSIASFKFTDKDGGFFNINSKNITLNSTINSNQNYINYEINKFQDIDKNVSIQANITLDAKQNKFFINSKVDISKDISVDLNMKSDSKRLSYAIDSNKPIPSLAQFVSLFKLDNIKYWLDTAINMDSLDLKLAYGYLEYDKTEGALKNFYAHGVANNLKYMYDEKLDSIKTKYTDLVFKDGTLFILPNSSKTYDFELDSSWLKIDFSKPKSILTLHLLFDGIVNDNLKHLLERYKIKLPFIQNSGDLNTDLTLKIILATREVDADGTFYTDKANITYLGLDLDLTNTLVKLKNTYIEILNMDAKYKDIAQAEVFGNIDLKKSVGFIDFNFNKIFSSNQFYLDADKQNLKVKYIINKQKDKIEIGDSKWLVNNQEATLEEISIPFDYANLTAEIPTTEFNIQNTLNAYFSGKAEFKSLKFDFDFDITEFKTENVELDQSLVNVKLSYEDNKIKLKSKDTINLYSNKQKIKLKKFNAIYENNYIQIKKSNIDVENLFNSNFDLGYSFNKKNGYLSLDNFSFKNSVLGEVFKKNKNISFKLKSANNQFIANSSSLNISAFISDETWTIAFSSLDKIQPYSPFLKKYHIDKGTFSIYKNKKDQNIKFLAKIDYDYDLLYIDNKLVSKYIVNGELKKNNHVKIFVNDKLNIDIQDGNLNLIGSNLGVNINQIVELINSIKTQDNDSKNYHASAILNNSYIYLNDKRRVIADKIDFQYLNKISTAQLIHKQGEAGFKYKDRKFHLYGSGFNSFFMENLFSMSKFDGGSLDFSIMGSIEKFDGAIFIKDTKIKEFRLLSNILAFVNTIPSLVTFSLPSYNTKGLHAKTAYMLFSYEDNIYDISDVYLESDELNILGRGKTSVKNNTIDMEFNLKTDLGSTASKIPVVGYILFNKDSISTTVKVTGKLDEPNIESMLAKEIIVAPLNIIKRTLLLPFSVFSDDE